MNQVGDSGMAMDNKENFPPSWGHTTKKTLAKGLLNVSLLLSNASQLKTLFDIHTDGRDGFWYAELVLIGVSILLQVVAAVLLLIQGFLKPKSQEHLDRANILNNVVTFLVLFITIINIVIAAFGIQLTHTAQ